MFALLSTAILALLYFILFLVTTTLFYIFGFSGVISLTISFLIVLIFSVIHFFISPFLYDLILKWTYSCNFVDVDSLPLNIANFIKDFFEKRSTKVPRIGIIEDYTPTAFTYGNFPSNARVVISRGMLEIMDEEELKAVLAHEFGHIFHYDFIFMTLVSLVPVLLYYVYRIAYNMAISSGSRRREGNGFLLIFAITTYIIYVISEYLVLYISRLREYYADKFSAYNTLNPNALATALIKVGYGLLNLSGKDTIKDSSSSFYKSPFKVLGLMDNKQAKNIALSLLNSINVSSSGSVALSSESIVVEEDIKTNVNQATIDLSVAAWDLFNPWATILELSSTHPLIAKRIRNLQSIAMELNRPFRISLPTSLPKEDDGGIDINPNSLWDEFIIDLFFQYLPLIGFVGGFIIASILSYLSKSEFIFIFIWVFVVSLANLLKWIFAYKGTFNVYKISDLLKKTKVSMIRSIPSIIEGTIVGKGVSGFIASEDVLLKDDTGFIYVDYKTGFSIGDLAYGFFVTNGLIGKKAKMKGYYRRAIYPYFEVIEIETEDDKKYRSYFKYLWFLVGVFVPILIGLLIMLI